jgi:hypothetical protein
MDFHFRMLKNSYRKVFVVESVNTWQFENEYDAATDLVLTLDFGLKHMIQSYGGEAHYLDAIGKVEVLQENNLILLEFLQQWFRKEDGKDFFVYKDIEFGKSLRLVFWSELMFFVRLCICLEMLKTFDYEYLILSENSNKIEIALKAIEIEFKRTPRVSISSREAYFFDIHRYMNEALMNVSFRYRAIQLYQSVHSRMRLRLDEFFNSESQRVCVQVYHPTLKVIQELRTTRGVQVITSGYVPTGSLISLFKQRILLSPNRKNDYAFECESILQEFFLGRKKKMVLASGRDITKECYDLIDMYIREKIPEALAEIVAALRFQSKLPLNLNVCISSIGISNIVNNEVCRIKGVQSFFIANGLLNSRFGDEGLDFDFINSYSASIKKHYFQNSSKARPLGDPRMDTYGSENPVRVVDREFPTIVIGASGFNSTDLTSYAAIEFEFLSDVLNSIIQVPNYGNQVEIKVKVRANGYLAQYKTFISQFYPFLNISVIQDTDIFDLLKNCDLYISIASQTLFEASCLGIPVVYYKNDREVLDSPFDSQSELPTFHSSDELAEALNDFRLGRDKFSEFQSREVMEKYIGPLDGRSLRRNIDFIMNLIRTKTV